MKYKWISKIEKDGLRTIQLSFYQYNLIDKDDKFLCKENYKYISYIEEDGLRITQLSDDKENLIDSKGNLIFKQNYNFISTICDINYNRRIDNKKIFNYKTYLKQKMIKNLLDKNN